MRRGSAGSKVFRRSVLALALGAPAIGLACPTCQYEVCFIKCVCVPNSSCVIPDLAPLITPIAPVILAPRLVVTTVEKAIQDVGATVHKAFDDTIVNLNKAGNDIGSNLGQAAEDSKAEAGRFGRELDATGAALAKAAQSQVTGLIKEAEVAADRVRQGKVVDAIWGAAIAPIQVAESSASEAVLESSYLRAVGQVAATSYGGPGGAAAYAAWLTYRQTGDPSLALRVGILTGATAATNVGAGKISDVARRTVVTAAIGGTAVAAAGGNAEAVKRAFLQAGAMVVVQDGFERTTGGPLDGKSSSGKAYCISASSVNCTPLPPGASTGVDAKGNFIVDMSKVDPAIPAVGLKDHTALFQETNVVMTTVSRIPGMQAMAVFHDNWAIAWDMNSFATPATILPAIVLTYVGTGAPYFDTLQTTAVERGLAGQSTTGVRPPEIAPSGDGGLAINLYQATAIGVLFSQSGAETKSLIHERRQGRLWCSNGALLPVKPLPSKPGKGGGGGLVLTEPRCLIHKKNPKTGDIFIAPYADINRDYACRLLQRESGKLSLVVGSLFDVKACDSRAEELFKATGSAPGAFYQAKGRAVQSPQ